MWFGYYNKAFIWIKNSSYDFYENIGMNDITTQKKWFPSHRLLINFMKTLSCSSHSSPTHHHRDHHYNHHHHHSSSYFITIVILLYNTKTTNNDSIYKNKCQNIDFHIFLKRETSRFDSYIHRWKKKGKKKWWKKKIVVVLIHSEFIRVHQI